MKLKQILPVIISLLFISGINAQIDKKEWEQGIAILAKNINIVSLQEQKDMVEADNAVRSLIGLNTPFTVNDVKSMIPAKYAVNRRLCDDLLRKLAAKKPASKEEAIIYLSRTVFDKELKDFISTNSRQLKRVDLQEVIKGELETLLFAPGYSGQYSLSGEHGAENSESDSGTDKKQNGSGISGFLIFGLDILTLILLAGLGYFLYKLTEHNNNEIKKLKKKIEDLKSNKADINEIDNINVNNEAINQKIQELTDMCTRAASAAQKKVQSLQDNPIDTSDPDAQILFLSEPTQDGYFQDINFEYRPGFSMYLLKTVDGINGTFSFIRKKEAIIAAITSVNTILRPACNLIGNTSMQNIQSVITETEGTVIREGNMWKVINKAMIRFE